MTATFPTLTAARFLQDTVQLDYHTPDGTAKTVHLPKDAQLWVTAPLKGGACRLTVQAAGVPFFFTVPDTTAQGRAVLAALGILPAEAQG